MCQSQEIHDMPQPTNTSTPQPMNTGMPLPTKYMLCPSQQNTCYAPAKKYTVHVMPQPKSTLYMLCPSQQTTRMLHTCICMPQLRNRTYAPANKYMIRPSQQIHVPDMPQPTIPVIPQWTKYKACPSLQIRFMPPLENFMSTTGNQ